MMSRMGGKIDSWSGPFFDKRDCTFPVPRNKNTFFQTIHNIFVSMTFKIHDTSLELILSKCPRPNLILPDTVEYYDF